MKTLVVPKFKSDDEEALWWDAHVDVVEANLSEAMRNGTAGRRTMMRVLQEARELAALGLPPEDLERARKMSRRKKIDCRSYILKLIHEGLNREEAAEKRAGRRKTA